MKKAISLVFLSFLLTLSACDQNNEYTSTTSYLQIVEKGYSDDYKEAWIIAFDPNNKNENENIKIIVDEPMVWNLIEADKTYFASYSKELDTPWKLIQIEHLNDDNTLR